MTELNVTDGRPHPATKQVRKNIPPDVERTAELRSGEPHGSQQLIKCHVAIRASFGLCSDLCVVDGVQGAAVRPAHHPFVDLLFFSAVVCSPFANDGGMRPNVVGKLRMALRPTDDLIRRRASAFPVEREQDLVPPCCLGLVRHGFTPSIVLISSSVSLTQISAVLALTPSADAMDSTLIEWRGTPVHVEAKCEPPLGIDDLGQDVLDVGAFLVLGRRLYVSSWQHPFIECVVVPLRVQLFPADRIGRAKPHRGDERRPKGRSVCGSRLKDRLHQFSVGILDQVPSFVAMVSTDVLAQDPHHALGNFFDEEFDDPSIARGTDLLEGGDEALAANPRKRSLSMARLQPSKSQGSGPLFFCVHVHTLMGLPTRSCTERTDPEKSGSNPRKYFSV